MRKLAEILKAFISLLLIIVLVVVGCYVGVFEFEKKTPERIYLYNHAFVAEKDEDGLHMWFVKYAPFSELENGDGVIYYEDNGYHSSNCEVGEDKSVAFYRSDDLNEQVSVSEENYIGQVLAQW